MGRYLDIDTQFFTEDGSGPLSGGKLYFYDSGTTDAKTTYSESTETTPNANPVVLDAYGIPGDIFFSGTAKVVLKDSDDVTLRTLDPVTAPG